jgi:hypothetical protein
MERRVRGSAALGTASASERPERLTKQPLDLDCSYA